MKHEDIWRALDTLAAENGLSASGLARRAGLGARTFLRHFKAATGRHPGAYIQALRIETAKAMLERYISRARRQAPSSA